MEPSQQIAEQIAIADARLQRLTRTLTDYQRAAWAYGAELELEGALVAPDERVLLEGHRASIARRADNIGIDALTAEAYPADALSDELSRYPRRRQKRKRPTSRMSRSLITTRTFSRSRSSVVGAVLSAAH